jgi:hypothetical protein
MLFSQKYFFLKGPRLSRKSDNPPADNREFTVVGKVVLGCYKGWEPLI